MVSKWKLSAKMNPHTTVRLIIFQILIVTLNLKFAEGGSCWLKIMDHGKCNSIITKNVSKEECCANSSDFGYSEEDVSDADLFFITAFKTGATCSACAENCSKTKCGPNKKCHMKNGRPKCSCSFDCKNMNSGAKYFKKYKEKVNLQSKTFLKREQLEHKTKLKDFQRNGRHRKNNRKLRRQQFEVGRNNSQISNRWNHTDKVVQIFPENSNSRKNGHKLRKNNNMKESSVCGSDGNSYLSICQLRKRACKTNSNLEVAYSGRCKRSCKTVNCPKGQNCLEDQDAVPHCVVCDMRCPSSSEPNKEVCGADGVTYPNVCELKRKSCLAGRAITLAYNGACKVNAGCDSITCNARQVCLQDLATHRPRCVSCSFKCTREMKYPDRNVRHANICGTNNQTFHSWCHMIKRSCETGFFIDRKHSGSCKKWK